MKVKLCLTRESVMREADRYYLKTSAGPITNDYGNVIKFNSYSDARHWAINHCNLSYLKRY